MPHEYSHRRRVEFFETDSAGIVHFSNYFRYVEMAEHAMFRDLGLSVHLELDGQTVSWPRVRAECSFRAPLRFEEEIEVRLVIREKSRSTLTYDFWIRKEDDTIAGEGRMKIACVALDPRTGRMQSTPIPACVEERIEVAPDDG